MLLKFTLASVVATTTTTLFVKQVFIEDEYAESEMVGNAELFYDEDDGDYDEYMEDCGYSVELVAENFTGSVEDAKKQYGCPSQYL